MSFLKMAKKLNLAALKRQIGFYPHDVQQEILQNMGRFTVIASAKRLGKSKLSAYLALRELFLPRRTVWVIGPNYELASRPWDYIEEWIDVAFEGDKGPFTVNMHDKLITNKTTGSKLWLKTTENPTSLLGKGLDLAIIDEAARIKNGVWDGYIRPNLMDSKGRAIMISNPYGYNWFYDKYLEGQKLDNEYKSFHYPTAIEDHETNLIGTNNPYIELGELQSIKDSTPRDIWTVEYLGEFREGAGARFKGWRHCIDESIEVDGDEWFEAPINSHLYYMGVDIGKLEDFTAVIVMDRITHRVVGYYRVNGERWDTMRDKVVEISEIYNDAEITLDATGMGGDMFAENLAEVGANVNTEFKYTNTTKTMLFDKLAMLMERKRIMFPKIRTLVQEVEAFSYSITDSGNIKLGSSKHDDTVNALALSCWNLNENPLGGGDYNQLLIPKRRRFN
jgi:hypothetical protein